MSLLGNVHKGPSHKPIFGVVNGRPGVGKSTLLANLPNSLILDYDQGLGEINCASIDMAQKSFGDLLDLLKEISEAKAQGKFEYQWLTLDSADHVESVIHKHVCAEHKWDSIEDPSYGKGYAYAGEKADLLIRYLRRLQQTTGINIMISCHAAIRTVNEPHLGESYDLYTSKLHKKFSASLYEAADMILFGAIKTINKTKNAEFGRRVTQGIVTGERILYTQPSTGIEAKNRFNLPAEIPMDATELLRLINEARKAQTQAA